MGVAIRAAISLIDFEAVVIDGAFPASIRSAVVESIREKFSRVDLIGLPPVEILEGTIGREARVLGAASLPFLLGLSSDRELSFPLLPIGKNRVQEQLAAAQQ